MKMTERFLYLCNDQCGRLGGSACARLMQVPTEHRNWVLLSSRIIFYPYPSQSDGFCPRSGSATKMPAHILEHTSALAAS